MKPPPRNEGRHGWSWDDDQENARQIQRGQDDAFWAWAARRLRMKKRDLLELLGRFIDARLQAALSKYLPPLAEQLTNPATAEAVRGAIVDLCAEDLAEIVQFMLHPEEAHDA